MMASTGPLLARDRCQSAMWGAQRHNMRPSRRTSGHIRDYHGEEYVEGDGVSDTYDGMPAEVRAAIDQLDEYAAQHCSS
jgi:hypothetical protein